MSWVYSQHWFHSKRSGQLLQGAHACRHATCCAMRHAAPPTCALGMHASTSSTNSRTGSDSTGGSSPPALARWVGGVAAG